VKRVVALVVLAAAFALATPSAAAAPRADLVVKLESSAGSPAAIAHRMGGDLGLVVASDTFVVEGALAAASVLPGVAWVAADTTYRSARQPTDACYTACPFSLDGQRELTTVHAPSAWDITTGSPSIQIAVLDGAVDVSHTDLAGKVTAGPSFVTDGCTDASDVEKSHATAVAGVAGAATDNALGIASLGWQTRVLAVRVLDECGVGTASEVAAGLRYAATNGARIINLSLAGNANPALADAIAFAQERGALVVAAAGNSGHATEEYPAAYPGVVAVGSTNPEGTKLSTFSNRGPWVDILAPGESIVSTSTLTGGYASYDGTSFAAPMVSAAAALVLATHPSFTPDDVAARLARTVKPLAGTNGLLDVAAALVDPPGGFVLLAADGGAFTFGDATYRGSAGGTRLNKPIVAAATAGTAGYWEAAADGGVFAYGVPFLGSMGGTRLNRPVVGLAATPTGNGYWLVASDGGIFTFGDAVFAGSTGALRLNKPIVGMAATPTGRGYWLVASDGGIFSFGDAVFAGSTGAVRLVSPIVGMAAAGRSSYWLVAADGGVFAFGSAPFFGSGAGRAGPGVVGMAAAPGSQGYWLARADGESLAFGMAVDGARTGHINAPIVAIGSTASIRP
jgi:subtilisin family serine protease